METDVEHTVCTSLRSVVYDERICAVLNEAVERMHRITFDATELLALHLTRCLNDNIPLPHVDASYFKMVMMEVTEGNGSRRRVDAVLSETRKQHMPTLKPQRRERLENVMGMQSTALATNFETNRWFHFRKRVIAYVKHARESDALAFADKETRRQHQLCNLKLATDICAPRARAFESDVHFHVWIAQQRDHLGTSVFEDANMKHNCTRHQAAMLRATWMLNKHRDARGLKSLAICPVRRHYRPAFIAIDSKGMLQLLGKGESDHMRECKRKSVHRRKCIKERQDLKRQLGVRFVPRSSFVLPRDEGPHLLHRASHHVEAVRTIQRWWRTLCFRTRAARWLHTLRHESLAIRLQCRARGWLVRQRRRMREAQAQHRAQHRAHLEAAKEVTWSDVLHLESKKLRVSKHWRFNGSIRTDGVSVRLSYRSAAKPKGKGTKRAREEHLPHRGLYTIDQLKHLSRMDMQLVGADPGKKELLVCVDADNPSTLDAQAERRKARFPSVRYTSAQRRSDMNVRRHMRTELAARPVALSDALEALSAFDSKSPDLTTLCSYFDTRRALLDDALSHYATRCHRQQKWRRFINGEVSITDFVRRIRSLQRDKNVPLVLAYGAWANVAGKPSAPCNRRHPPCVGIGLRAKLSKHFLVVSTPEASTSKTCSLCGSCCGNCQQVDAARRITKMMIAKDDAARARAARYSVRGLRRCQNESCAAHLNRDYNAAINIQRRCKAMLSSAFQMTLDETDATFERLTDIMRADG